MKVFISQPMTGRSKEEILIERLAITNIVKRMYGDDTEIIDSYEESDNNPVKLLGKAIEKLADADLMVIAPGSENSRGCRVERTCCGEYHIRCIFIPKDMLEVEYGNMATDQLLNDGADQRVDNPLKQEDYKPYHKDDLLDALRYALDHSPIFSAKEISKPSVEMICPTDRKTIIVINGKGGVGKDTLCGIAGEYFNVQSISAIDPIKEMARNHMHWDNDKSDRGRKLLSDLKAISIQYNDMPNTYLVLKANDFIKPDNPSQILFVHIREPEEIDKFIHSISLRATCQVKTMLIRSDKLGKEHYGNDSDDNVEKYEYDYYFDNNGTLEETEPAFIKFLLKEVGV